MTAINIRPGDVVLFSGRTPIHQLVQRLTKGSWTQVGLVLSLPNCNELLLMEATSIPVCPDTDTGSYSPGVRTVQLEARLSNFSGTAASRSLWPPLNAASVRDLVKFRDVVRGRSFDFSLQSARRSIRRLHVEWKPHFFTCSSLVTYAYQSIGVMERPPKGPLPNNVLPGDFALEGNLILSAGYAWAPTLTYLGSGLNQPDSERTARLI